MKEFIQFLYNNNISLLQSRREKIYNFIKEETAKEIFEAFEKKSFYSVDCICIDTRKLEQIKKEFKVRE